jgi:hypothetical protein
VAFGAFVWAVGVCAVGVVGWHVGHPEGVEVALGLGEWEVGRVGDLVGDHALGELLHLGCDAAAGGAVVGVWAAGELVAAGVLVVGGCDICGNSIRRIGIAEL